MRHLIVTIIGFLISISLFAQAPGAFKYQAVARADNGDLITNQQVSFKISILQGSESGTAVYTETHRDSTNAHGLVTLEIGSQTTEEELSAINWSDGPYFVRVEMDETGGTDYQLMGTSQLLSVPYAITAGNIVKKNEYGKYYKLKVDELGQIQWEYLSPDTVVQIDFNGTLYVYPVDNSTGVEWGGFGTEVTDGNGADSETDGEANTSAIVSQLGSDAPAAYICDTLKAFGHSDWYLPSKKELDAMYQNKGATGGFRSDYYWSSSEAGANYSWYQYFENGNQNIYDFDKTAFHRVRCVRRD